ncbi:HET-domain-containing protein [Cenococcum geophilum 1.58]|uniref:HET-domain-containing protein n=1 Tax=Cenococcum geophilum 1.58 TaxID=794803 RepID=UPI00358DF643|nr:HET-domain-containing protein [Cenococcum geophilum 1.58]
MNTAATLYPQRLSPENNEIRLLTIQRGAFKEPIRCSLRAVCLDDNPTYTALSYVWGDATITKPILVDGSPFEATINLESALWHIRKSDSDQVFWVDAVCINQSDAVERNAQVSLMGAIYSKCSDMLAWLGEADLASDMLVNALSENSVPSQPDPQSEGFVELAERYFFELQKLSLLIKAISKRAWFKRVWVSQEFLLPKKDPIFQCGSAFIECAQFFEAVSAVSERSIRNVAHDLNMESSYKDLQQRLGMSNHDAKSHSGDLITLASLGVMRYHSNRGDFPAPLYAAIALSVGRLSTVPHDYIYGFLGLVRNDEKTDLIIDYQRSHWDLYREVMDFLIFQGDGDNLRCLSMLSFKSQSNQYPSWVVDFSAQTNVTKYTGTYLAAQDSWTPVWDVWTSDDGEILMLEGVYLDVVARAHHIPEHTDWTGTWRYDLTAVSAMAKSGLHVAQTFEKKDLQLPPEKLRHASRSSGLHRLFLANSDQARFRDEPEQTMDGGRFRVNAEDRQWDYWFHLVAGPTHGRLEEIDGLDGLVPRLELDGLSIRAFVAYILTATLLACSGRTLVVTKGGLLAIAVPDVQEGDVLVYLFGMHAPWILRPVPNKPWYTVVGMAFVNGLMDWKVLDECYDEGLLSVATFCIR